MEYQIRIEIVAYDEDAIEEPIYKNTFPDFVRLEENLGSLEKIVDNFFFDKEARSEDQEEWTAEDRMELAQESMNDLRD